MKEIKFAIFWIWSNLLTIPILGFTFSEWISLTKDELNPMEINKHKKDSYSLIYNLTQSEYLEIFKRAQNKL